MRNCIDLEKNHFLCVLFGGACKYEGLAVVSGPDQLLLATHGLTKAGEVAQLEEEENGKRKWELAVSLEAAMASGFVKFLGCQH